MEGEIFVIYAALQTNDAPSLQQAYFAATIILFYFLHILKYFNFWLSVIYGHLIGS